MHPQNVKAATLDGIENFVHDLGVHLLTRAHLYFGIFLFCHMKFSSIQSSIYKLKIITSFFLQAGLHLTFSLESYFHSKELLIINSLSLLRI